MPFHRPLLVLRAAIAAATIASLAACGSSGSAPAPSTVQSSTLGSLVITPNLSKLLAAVRKNPKFIGPSADTLSYVVWQNGSSLISSSIALSSCGPTCPAIAVAPGSGYGIELTLKLGSTAIGCGSYGLTGCSSGVDGNTTPFTVTSGSPTNISPIIEPLTSGNSAGPTVSVSSSAVFISGTTSSVPVTLQELDPVGNLINTSNGPVNNWPSISMNLTDSTGCFALTPTTVTSPPSSAAGTSVSLTYTAPCSTTGAPTVSVSAFDGATSSNTITVPIVSLTTTTSSISTSINGDSGSFTATELTNLSPSTFTASPFGVAQTCGSGAITVTQGSYVTGPGQLQQTYTVQQSGATQPICHVRITATDHVTLHADVSINGG